MTLLIKFAGWFQCRLPTAPDPTDEPRGVSGYAHALPNEPDFDRIIRLQPKLAIQRSHCQPIGVYVKTIWIDGTRQDDHPLLGGDVDFLDNPKFEGRNNIVVEDDGYEAIFPLHIQIKNNNCLIRRKFKDNNIFPSTENGYNFEDFNQLKASGLHINPGIVSESTGIFDLSNVWKKRKEHLEKDLQTAANEIEMAALNSRINFLTRNLKSKNGLYNRFAYRMLYMISLTGSIIFQYPEKYFIGKPSINPESNEYEDWSLEFWCGGWDADSLSGYIEGYLGIPMNSDNETILNLNRDINEKIKEPLKRRF